MSALFRGVVAFMASVASFSDARDLHNGPTRLHRRGDRRRPSLVVETTER